MLDYKVTENNIHITDSYKIGKHEFDSVLWSIRELYPECRVFNLRSMRSMKKEWATHNALYSIGICRSRTKDVDLNAPICWVIKATYCVVGSFVWFFIK